MDYNSDKLFEVVRHKRAEREMTKSFDWADFINECEMIYCMQAPSHYKHKRFTGQMRRPRMNTNPTAYGYRLGNIVYEPNISIEDAMKI